MKNTKGPWSFDGHGVNQVGTGLRIAKLSQPAYDHSSGLPERIESFDADGHLLAAAPDLFEALETIANAEGKLLAADAEGFRVIAKKAMQKARE